MKNPEGLILAYATQYMATAADGPSNEDSPFTAALLSNIRTPGLDVKDLFFRVGSEVIAKTKGQQRPEISVSFYDSYALVPAKAGPSVQAPMPAVPIDPAAQAWSAARETTSVAVLEDFIRRYGGSFYATMARARLDELRKSPVDAPITVPGPPIKIGFSMALTGGLGPNGRSALIAQKIWEEDVNAKGGLLGRQVKLVYYDDQSNPSTVPGIYTRLLDGDKVDLVVGGYATAMLAPAMPIVMQRKKLFVGLLGLGVNLDFKYASYFAMLPAGPDPKTAFTEGFFELAMQQKPKPRTVAIIAADAEFSRNAADGARANARKHGLPIVYDKTYPLATTDYAPMVRAVAAANPDIVVVCSYPPDSVGIVRAVDEVGFKPRMIGGVMVGLQHTAFKAQLGPLLNGFVNYDFWLPVPKMRFPGVDDLMRKYQERAAREQVDPLGYYMAPQAYAQLQVLAQAITATGSLDDAKLADYFRRNAFRTVLGEIRFGAGGEWAEPRVLQVQFQNIRTHDVDQFKDPRTQVVAWPGAYASGSLIYPYERAK